MVEIVLSLSGLYATPTARNETKQGKQTESNHTCIPLYVFHFKINMIVEERTGLDNEGRRLQSFPAAHIHRHQRRARTIEEPSAHHPQSLALIPTLSAALESSVIIPDFTL